jgi:hypothetical protein
LQQLALLKAAASDNCLAEHFTLIFVIGALKKESYENDEIKHS